SFSEEMLSVELGPGLLSRIYEGLQNPLPQLAEQSGFFLQRGIYLDPLDRKTKWEFTPSVKPGAVLLAGDSLGTVPEGIFKHRIMIPFDFQGNATVKSVAGAGSYTVLDEIAVVTDEKGRDHKLTMKFTWPVKRSITNY